MRKSKNSKKDLLFDLKPRALRIKLCIELDGESPVRVEYDQSHDSRRVQPEKRERVQEMIEQTMAGAIDLIVSRTQRIIVER